MPFLDMLCEGKAECTNTISIGLQKAQQLRQAGRPTLCPDCKQVYGGMTCKAIDVADPRPKTMAPREIT